MCIRDRGGVLDGRQQRQGGGGRPRADLVLEQLLAAVEGQHGRRPVATQVVQAHDAPVGVFRQRLGLQQLQRQWQGAGAVSGGFQGFDVVFQGFARLRLSGTAAGGQPGIELGAFRYLPVGQQTGRSVQVVGDPRGQLQDGRAANEIGAGQFAQAKQPLAQRVARGFGAAAWPQQCGQAFAGTGAFQRQPGQQQGIGSGQRVVAAADADGGRTGQEQTRSVDSHGPQDLSLIHI